MRAWIYLLVLLMSSELMTQEIIHLPITKEDPDVSWDREEQSFHSSVWDTEVVTNVSKPTLVAFKAQEPSIAASVIICPGGGQYAHSIESEGYQVASWLQKKGITAFVLKYRLVPTGEDGTKQIMTDGAQVEPNARQLLPLSTSDAQHALRYVREHADKYNIDPSKVGLMGFSAGGAVTMNTTYSIPDEEKPDFIAPIYAWMNIVDKGEVPTKRIPSFIACASDDPLRLAPASIEIYNDWTKAGQQAEIHMYAKGGHGFGMRELGLPSDQWIEHFGTWIFDMYQEVE